MELDECAAILYVKDKDSKEEEIKEEYYILKKIGLGGTSIVYLCQSSLDGHEYALKLYSNIDAYQTETQLLRLIQSSKNIVKLIKSGEGILERGNSLDNASVADFIGKNFVKFAVFEYLPNGELLEYIDINKEGFNEKICKNIFRCLIEAVELCHISGVVHGDIKLQNIMLSENFEIKLIDFGFSRLLNNGELFFQWSGTIGYSAPETFQSEAHGYNGIKNDIFGLGVVLFMIIFGYSPFSKPAFTDNNYKLIIKKEYDAFWKQVNKTNINISDNLKDLIHKMICFDESSRISIEEIKAHPWLFNSNNDSCCDKIVENEDDIEDLYIKELIKRKELIDLNKKDLYE